jgi:N-acylneuraminate cytidylyltransferase
MRIAIIPARGGSKRIKNKNIVDFFGKPMIAYALEAAKGSGLFDVIHVSTDDAAIAATVERLGFPIDFMRAPELADDHTPIMPVLRWVIERYRIERNRIFDDVGLFMACAPLIEAEDIRRGFDIYRAHGGKAPVMAVAPYPVPVEWAFDRKDDGRLEPVSPGASAIRSQDLTKKYFDAGAFYFYPREIIEKNERSTYLKYVSTVIPRTKAVDIDDMEDLELAKALFAAKMGRRPS